MLAEDLRNLENLTTISGIRAASAVMMGLTEQAGGPEGLARWIRYRVDRAEACGNLVAVCRLMGILACIAGLGAAITPTDLNRRIDGILVGNKATRTAVRMKRAKKTRARNRARKKPGSVEETPPGE